MADEKKKRTTGKKNSSTIIGSQARATTLDKTVKLDIDTSKTLIDDLIDAGLSGGLNSGDINSFTMISNSRDQIYQSLDSMAADPDVAAVINQYTREATEYADNGHIMWAESNDPNVSKHVNYILNRMNVDKNLPKWMHSLVQYGDVYLRLYRESDYSSTRFKADKYNALNHARQLNEGIEDSNLKENINISLHGVNDKYSFYLEEVADPCTMFELTKYGQTVGYIETPNEVMNISSLSNYMGNGDNGYYNFRMKSNDINIYQADDFVHACLDDNFTRYPEQVSLFNSDSDYNSNTSAEIYKVKRGKSMLYDAYKVWREKSLLEASIMLNRLTRSSLVRTISVECGDMGKNQVRETLRRVKELFEQKTALNPGSGMSEYTNPGPIENNVYFATHNGQGAVTVGQVGGDVNVKDLADLDNWVNKFYAAFGVPKQYFGYTEDGAGFNGGTSLSILSSVFSKGVKHIQNAMIQALTDAINLFLVSSGCYSYIDNFTLKMKTPVSQEEIDFRSNLTERVNAISNMQSLFADIEDKGRRLEILKSLVATLNYGDDILDDIQQEIDDYERAKAEEAANAEAEDNEEIPEEMQAEESSRPSAIPAEEESLPTPEEIKEESLDTSTKNNSLTEDFDDLLVEDNLPTPEEINESKDFTDNE